MLLFVLGASTNKGTDVKVGVFMSVFLYCVTTFVC